MSDSYPAAAAAESTFMVFTLDGVPIGVPAAAVEAVLPDSDPCRPTIARTAAGDGDGDPASAARLLALRSRNGERPRIRTQGVLQVVSVPRSRVVALPRLCVTAGSATVEVALSEEQVLFLIADPYRLAYGPLYPPAGSTSEAGVVASLQESR